MKLTGCLPVLLLLAGPAFGVGPDEEDEVPAPSETVTECVDGQIWDADAKTCIAADHQSLDDATRLKAVRELAYAGAPERALQVLAAIRDQTGDMVLTYYGFAHRKAGRYALGMAYYAKALALNPDNLLARSYRGMALVEAGERRLARAELEEILSRGGAGSRPAVALAQAIRSGVTTRY